MSWDTDGSLEHCHPAHNNTRRFITLLTEDNTSENSIKAHELRVHTDPDERLLDHLTQLKHVKLITVHKTMYDLQNMSILLKNLLF